MMHRCSGEQAVSSKQPSNLSVCGRRGSPLHTLPARNIPTLSASGPPAPQQGPGACKAIHKTCEGRSKVCPVRWVPA
ncbi:hypothetical protein CHUAL_009600 [Chamberlinius hualienensis]